MTIACCKKHNYKSTDAAAIFHISLQLKITVLRCLLNAGSNDDAITKFCRLFYIQTMATTKAWSLTSLQSTILPSKLFTTLALYS